VFGSTGFYVPVLSVAFGKLRDPWAAVHIGYRSGALRSASKMRMPAVLFKGVSSNGANRPQLQTWPNVAPFGEPGIGGLVELPNLGVTVQK